MRPSKLAQRFREALAADATGAASVADIGGNWSEASASAMIGTVQARRQELFGVAGWPEDAGACERMALVFDCIDAAWVVQDMASLKAAVDDTLALLASIGAAPRKRNGDERYPRYAPRDLLERLREVGLTLESRDGILLVTPGSTLTPEQSAQVREHKADLLELMLYERQDVMDALVEYAWEHPDETGLLEIALVEWPDGTLKPFPAQMVREIAEHNHRAALAFDAAQAGKVNAGKALRDDAGTGKKATKKATQAAGATATTLFKAPTEEGEAQSR